MFYIPLPGTGLESNWRSDYYGGSNFSGHIPAQTPILLRVRRRGRLMEAFYNATGRDSDWVRVGSAVDFGDRLQSGVTVGLSVTAHDEAQIAQAVFDSVTLNFNVPPQPPFNFKATPRPAAVLLTWDAAPGAAEYRVYRQVNRTGDFVPVTDARITDPLYVDRDVEPHAIYFYRVSAVNANGEEFASNETYARVGPANLMLGSTAFRSADIGTSFQGDADINPDGDVLSVYAAGNDIFGASDSFRFTYKPMCGDGEVVARTLQLDAVDPFSKAGIMIRESDAADARNFALLWTGTHGFHVQWRANTGGGTTDAGEDIPGDLGMYMRIVREGFTFTAYVSQDGKNWRIVGPRLGVTVFMGTAALQGIAVTSHNNSRGGLAQLDRIETGAEGPSNPNDPPLVPGQLTVDGGIRRIYLSWGSACNATRYSILRGTRPDNLMPYRTGPQAVTGTTFVDEEPNVMIGTTYYYQIKGVNGAGIEGEATNVDNAQALPNIDFSGGFVARTNLTLNGSAAFSPAPDNFVRLTSGSGGQAGTFYSNARAGIERFVTRFTFRIFGGSNPKADGMVFIIQSNGRTALGPAGGGLAYGADNPAGGLGIRNSIAVKFDIYNNSGEGINSTGLFTDGRSPTVRAGGLAASIPDRSVSLDGSGINLHSEHVFSVVLCYDGSTLTEKIRDTEMSGAMFTTTYSVNIRSFTGSNTAFIGFGGGTGGLTAIQDIRTWRYDEVTGTVSCPDP
jgi:hypothetical protein